MPRDFRRSTLGETLESRLLLAAAFAEFVDPNPSIDNGFGLEVVPLSTGNVVITAPFDDAGGTDAGAVYLFNGATGELISTLIGSSPDDRVGLDLGHRSEAITPLANGNFLVSSPWWDNGQISNAGAVTFASGITGVSGSVSPANSLVGSISNQVVGTPQNEIDETVPVLGVIPLPNGNYIVTNENTPNGATPNVGSVTHGDGTTGTTGVISTSNSLLGTSADDEIASGGITVLANGNYVISSPLWNNGTVTDAGAITFVDGQTGLIGVVDSGNSVIGGHESAGLSQVTPLTNGNYVIDHSGWRNAAGDTVGAAMLVDGTTGATGTINAARSLIGSTDGDRVSSGGVYPLTNGNFVVSSPEWDHGNIADVAAITWRSGVDFTSAAVASTNSLIGDTAGVGTTLQQNSVFALQNGNAVARTTVQGNPSTTFIDGANGASGVTTMENSLVLALPDSESSGFSHALMEFSNGTYLVSSTAFPDEGQSSYSLTVVDGTTGMNGMITEQNSLIRSGASIHEDMYALPPTANFVASYRYRELFVFDGTTPATGLFPESDIIRFPNPSGIDYVIDPIVLSNGNFVIEVSGGPPNTFLVDGTEGLTGEVPFEGRIPGTDVQPLANGHYVFKEFRGSYLRIGDGENRGVSVEALSPGFSGAHSNSMRQYSVGDQGNLVSLNISYSTDEIDNAGAIVFIDGNPNFDSGYAETNFVAGARSGFTQSFPGSHNSSWEVVTDDVNGHFYVGFSADGIAQVIAGSLEDGFENGSGNTIPVNLSVSSSSASEADAPEVTVTVTADGPVSGKQEIVIEVQGSQITDRDYRISNRVVTIPDGETSGTVTLTVLDDFWREGIETLQLSLANPSSGLQLGDITEQAIQIEDNTSRHVVLDEVPRFPGTPTPTFTWNDVGATGYEVWLARTSPGSSRIQFANRYVTDTSYTSVEDLTAGTYKIWVRPVSDPDHFPYEIGNWSFNASFEIRPTLIAPLDTAISRRPEFRWDPIPEVDGYQIWINTTSGRVIEYNIAETSWTPSEDLPAGIIRWWIRATSSTTGGWSAPGAAVVAGSDRAVVLTPTGTTSNQTPVFTWTEVENSSRYILHVQNLTTGSVVIREDHVLQSSFTPQAGLASGNYRVWVKAIGASGDFSDGAWSAPVNFIIASIDEPSSEFEVQLVGLIDLLNRESGLDSVAVQTPGTQAIENDVIWAGVTEDYHIAAEQRSVIAPASPQPVDSPVVPLADSNDSESLLTLLWEQQQLSDDLLLSEPLRR